MRQKKLFSQAGRILWVISVCLVLNISQAMADCCGGKCLPENECEGGCNICAECVACQHGGCSLFAPDAECEAFDCETGDTIKLKPGNCRTPQPYSPMAIEEPVQGWAIAVFQGSRTHVIASSGEDMEPMVEAAFRDYVEENRLHQSRGVKRVPWKEVVFIIRTSECRTPGIKILSQDFPEEASARVFVRGRTDALGTVQEVQVLYATRPDLTPVFVSWIKENVQIWARNVPGFPVEFFGVFGFENRRVVLHGVTGVTVNRYLTGTDSP